MVEPKADLAVLRRNRAPTTISLMSFCLAAAGVAHELGAVTAASGLMLALGWGEKSHAVPQQRLPDPRATTSNAVAVDHMLRRLIGRSM